MNDPVFVDMRKWDGRPHWGFVTRRLGRDEHGTWLAAAPPTRYRGPRGPGTWTHPFVVLVPHDQWWIATFNAPTADLEAQTYIDLATPGTWPAPNHLVATDLDLDVVRTFDGRVELLDEDELAEHAELFAYPPEVVTSVRVTAATLVDAVRTEKEPFGMVWRGWLKEVEDGPKRTDAPARRFGPC